MVLETPDVLRRLARSHRQLAELKGVVGTIPNESILIDTLALQEAKDFAEIENVLARYSAPTRRRRKTRASAPIGRVWRTSSWSARVCTTSSSPAAGDQPTRSTLSSTANTRSAFVVDL